MVRKQIYIETFQDAQLKMISRKLAIPEAELIRQGINHYLSSPFHLPRDLRQWEDAKNLMLLRMKKPSSKRKRTWSREEIYE
jgi:hypothetical protein